MTEITQEELVQFLYNEAPPEKIYHIEQQLEVDTLLQERFKDLKIAKNKLDKIKLISPDKRSVDNIFNYSKRGILELDTLK
ncbi:MAG: hypothetical protein ABL929_12640 [Ferruginibacter sp.]|nr:hypothetical protein [Ferruginibacter sp.]